MIDVIYIDQTFGLVMVMLIIMEYFLIKNFLI